MTRPPGCASPRGWSAANTPQVNETVAQADMETTAVALSPHDRLPDWNYTLHPWPTNEM